MDDIITNSAMRGTYDANHNAGFHPYLATNPIKYTYAYFGTAISRFMPSFTGVKNFVSRLRPINLEDLK
jgi:hypothetical protein